MTHPALLPGQIGPLLLRNRIVKTATFEGMTPGGFVTRELVAHHAGMAAAGVGLTTVAYGAVEDAGRTFADQLLVDEERVPGLVQLASAVHARGGAISLQLAHCGGFSKHARPAGPSGGWNAYGTVALRPWIRSMERSDMERVIAASARAATLAVDAGFDAVELHLGHGYLLSQFLSPLLNRRADRYGGSLQDRMRFPLEVVDAVIAAVGERAAVVVKMNLSDGVEGGLPVEEAPSIGRALESAGVHALVTSGGLVQRSAFFLMRGDVPLARMAAGEESWLQAGAMRLFGGFLVKAFPWTPGFFVEAGRPLVDSVDLPVVALGGLNSAETLQRASDAGYDFFAMGRTLLADPDFIHRLERGEAPVSRCTHCNLCVADMHGGVRCHL